MKQQRKRRRDEQTDQRCISLRRSFSSAALSANIQPELQRLHQLRPTDNRCSHPVSIGLMAKRKHFHLQETSPPKRRRGYRRRDAAMKGPFRV